MIYIRQKFSSILKKTIQEISLKFRFTNVIYIYIHIYARAHRTIYIKNSKNTTNIFFADIYVINFNVFIRYQRG